MSDLIFEYSKLRGRIIEKFETIGNFADVIGISRSSFSMKLNNSSEFSQYEIKKISEKLEIPKNEIEVYFFTEKVQ